MKFPSKILKDKFNLNLFIEYKFPENKSVYEIEKFIDECYDSQNWDFLGYLFGDLIELNPELEILKDIQFDNVLQVLYGITSGYPAKDIKYFCEEIIEVGWKDGMGVENCLKYSKINNELKYRFGVEIGGYIPHPENLELIHDALFA